MKLIALETSAEACSAALWVENEIVERFAVVPRQHSERILPMIGEVLAEAGVSRKALDGVVFGCGPGSFTGVRIATGVAQGLAFALDIPVVPVSTLEILAQGVRREHGASRVLACFDARMDEVYWAACILDDDGLMGLVGEQLVCRPGEVPIPAGEDWTGAGGGWRTYSGQLAQRLPGKVTGLIPGALCHARDAAVLGAPRFAAGRTVSAADALPVYLRNTVAWKKA
jgi:tRNA threonylcarbamoyladenosine biosynthesis protein TsaB